MKHGEQMVSSSEGTRALALQLCREFEDKFLQHLTGGEVGSFFFFFFTFYKMQGYILSGGKLDVKRDWSYFSCAMLEILGLVMMARSSGHLGSLLV